MEIETWFIITGAFSISISIIAIALAIIFYITGRNTEKNISTSLGEIKSQTDTLQKLSGSWMNRLIKHVTEKKPDMIEKSIPKLIDVLSQLPQNITSKLPQLSQAGDSEEINTEIISAYIALYYYTAQTNYWSQYYLPSPEEFDSTNDFDNLVKQVVDNSVTDFTAMLNILNKCEPKQLEDNPLYHLFKEAENHWKSLVKSSSDIFIQKSKKTV